LQETGRPGTVRYYGCPAEEIGAGKVFMARAGAFDDLDLAITWHPGEKNTVWMGSSLAIDHIKFRFKGKTAHAAAAPEHGRSALDAVELTNIGVNFMREHIIEQARIHYVITNGGGAPNVVPDDAEVWYYVRAPRRDQVQELTDRVRKVAQGAALMTETTVEERDVHGLHNYLPNMALGGVAQAALEELGAIDFTEGERAFAHTLAMGYPETTRAASLAVLEIPSSRPTSARRCPARPMSPRLVGSPRPCRSPRPAGPRACRATAGGSPPPAGCRSATRGCCTPPRRWR
jgi:aminobenzoyl-glutamate utilization protein B